MHQVRIIRTFILSQLANLLVLYLLTFLIFAIIRVVTGISIKRMGYFALCHVSYSPKPHVYIYARRIGLSFHRPTLTRPGWVSVYLSNLEITIDAEYFTESGSHHKKAKKSKPKPKPVPKIPTEGETEYLVKEWIPENSFLFHVIQFVLNHGKYIDFSASNSVMTIAQVGTVLLGNLIIKVDLRLNSGVTDSNKFTGTLDNHKFKQGEAPIFARFLIQDMLFTAGDPDEVKQAKDGHSEVIDFVVMDTKGIIDKANLHLKDLSISWRLGAVKIQGEHWIEAVSQFKKLKAAKSPPNSPPASPEAPAVDLPPHTRTLAEKLSIAAVRVIKEIEFKITSMSITNAPLDFINHSHVPLKQKAMFTSSTQDFSLDLRRLNSKNPTFRLSFSDDDTAHQAIFTCSSFTFGVEHNGAHEEVIYIPLITAISKTNIFSKTIRNARKASSERNNTILHANVNVTTPSISLEPQHVGIFINSFSGKSSKSSSMSGTTSSFQQFQRLWPKAVIKFTIDEPATRILVHKPKGYDAPIPYAKLSLTTEFKGLVSYNFSKVYCDFVSSHTETNGQSNYNVMCSFQLSQFEAWYRSAEGRRFEFLSNESLALQVSAVLNPSLSLSVTGHCDKPSVLTIHSEVLYGFREVLQHIKNYRNAHASEPTLAETKNFFLRQLPESLSNFKFDISSLTIAIAADALVDYISTARGVKLEVSKLSLEYNSVLEPVHLKPSTEIVYEPSDHRQLDVTYEGISGYKIMGLYYATDKLTEQFLDIPTFKISLLTDRDVTGPVARCHVCLPTADVQWDFNLQYLIALCIHIGRATFRPLMEEKSKNAPKVPKPRLVDSLDFSVRTSFITIKAILPQDVHVMLETNGVMFELNPGNNGLLTAAALRLYTLHPNVIDAWTRLLTFRNVSIDLKEKLSSFGKPVEINDKEQILISTSAVRLNIAHQLVAYKLLDNIISTFKGIITVTRRALLDDENYIFPLSEKEKMPNIPKIRIKAKALLFAVEDDTFEAKLNLIFQVGLREQKRRLEKEVAFKIKVDAIKKARKAKKDSDPMKARGEFPLPSEPFSFIDTLINNKPSERVPKDRKPQQPKDAKPAAQNKPKHRNTFKAFQKSIHPFHTSIPRQHTAPDESYEMIDDLKLSEDHSIDIATARYRLDKFYSDTWIRVYNEAEKNLKNSIKKQLAETGLRDTITTEMAAKENVMDYSPFPFLFFLHIANLDWFISKPSFNDAGLRDFLFDVGKGFPRDTRLSINIPLYVKLQCQSLRVQLRDYPLPLLYFPHMHPSQSHEMPSVVIEGNFVVAEAFSDLESNIRKVFVPLDPLVDQHMAYPDHPEENPFMVEVHRTVASVKMYTDLKFSINTLNPSSFTWCVSMQPALQAAMQVFELFTKPPQDPSEKLGFWDNIRSIFHARFALNWPEGNVHFHLKGSANPYYIVQEEAGFVMCWKNNVKFTVNADDNPQEFMVVTSDDYVLAIPDLSFQERDYLANSATKSGGLTSRVNFKESTVFQKVIMKLSGKVKWSAGVVFERKKQSGGRTFKFRPHYDVVLSNPLFVKDMSTYDAYRGFRSDFLHFAVNVASTPAIADEDSNTESYNSIHLSPKFFAHFYKWWDLFGGAQSLPIRAGKLFNQGPVVQSKKLGRHMFSVKYQLRLSPIFISHAYIRINYDAEEKTCTYTTTGLKAKIDEFVMDLHQSRAQAGPGKRWKMGLHVGEMDFKGTDLRVLLAKYAGRNHEDAVASTLGISTSPGSSIANSTSNTSSSDAQYTTGKFNISDNDFSWIDSDDYVEVGERGNLHHFPMVDILPFSYTPRWTYFRQTDHANQFSSILPFGTEPSHVCYIGKGFADTTSAMLLHERLGELDEQLKTKQTMLESLQKDFQGVPDTQEVSKRIVKVKNEVLALAERIEKIQFLISTKANELDPVQVALEKSGHEIAENIKRREKNLFSEGEEEVVEPINNGTAAPGSADSFNNIFLIHSSQIIWNNEVRNALYSYLTRVGERRASAYFLTQRAVKYLDDLIKKQTTRTSSEEQQPFTETLGNLFEDIRSRGCLSEDSKLNGDLASDDFDVELRNTTSEDTYAVDNHLVRFVAPQMQFISTQNPDQCVLVTSENIELKIVNILDKQIEDDEDSKLVETRYGISLHDAQFFVINKEKVAAGAYTLFSNMTYGCGKFPMWPPWVSIECHYDSSPLKNALIIEKTSVTLRYDKPNSLRVQAGKEAGSLKNTCSAAMIRDEKHRQNRVAINFPKVVATCDSKQFYATFNVVMDLLIYSEPIQKERSERLDKVLLATDFTNIQGAAMRVRQLQTKVRSLAEVRTEFLLHMSELSKQAAVDLARVEVEQDEARMELYVMMEAIKSGMRKVSRDDDTTQFLKLTLGADQIIWHVLNGKHEPFLDVGLANASFNRISGTDGFNANSVEVGILQAFNLMPGSFYPDVFSPLMPDGQKFDALQGNVVSINWTMLDPIGGIPIVQQFDVRFNPIKVQIESQTWDMLFDYIFPKTPDGKQIESPFSGGLNKQVRPSLDIDSLSSDDETDDASSITPSMADSEAGSRVFKRSSLSFLKRSNDTTSISSSGSSTTNSSGFKPKDVQRSSTGASISSMGRSSSKSTEKSSKSSKDKGKAPEDDLSVMVNRASNYLSIVQIRIFSSTVCISYKGEGSKTLLDIHEFTMTLPDIQYENKTWSNMDIVLRLKKDVTKILLHHTGKLIGNKFKRHHHRRNSQQLNQLESYVAFTSIADLAPSQRSGSVTPKDDATLVSGSARITPLPTLNEMSGSMQITDEPGRNGSPGKMTDSPGTRMSRSASTSSRFSMLSRLKDKEKDKEKEDGEKKKSRKRLF